MNILAIIMFWRTTGRLHIKKKNDVYLSFQIYTTVIYIVNYNSATFYLKMEPCVWFKIWFGLYLKHALLYDFTNMINQNGCHEFLWIFDRDVKISPLKKRVFFMGGPQLQKSLMDSLRFIAGWGGPWLVNGVVYDCRKSRSTAK